MAVQILSQSYGPRKPLIECTADSLTELAGLVCAEGSKATVGGTEYVLDRVNGWIEPGSGGGGGSGVFVVHENYDETLDNTVLDKTGQEIYDAVTSGNVVIDLMPPQDGLVGLQYIVDAAPASGGGYGFTFVYWYPTGELKATMYLSDSPDGYPAVYTP